MTSSATQGPYHEMYENSDECKLCTIFVDSGFVGTCQCTECSNFQYDRLKYRSGWSQTIRCQAGQHPGQQMFSNDNY